MGTADLRNIWSGIPVMWYRLSFLIVAMNRPFGAGWMAVCTQENFIQWHTKCLIWIRTEVILCDFKGNASMKASVDYGLSDGRNRRAWVPGLKTFSHGQPDVSCSDGHPSLEVGMQFLNGTPCQPFDRLVKG